MSGYRVRCVPALVVLAIIAPLAHAQLSAAERKTCEQQLRGLLLHKRLVARAAFPAYKYGIGLHVDGAIEQGMATRYLKEYGVGVEVDEAATVTDVKVKDKHVEIHLNGGGFGSFADALISPGKEENMRHSPNAKAPGGSRINLHFDRALAPQDCSDLERFAAYLDPLVDTRALKEDASRARLLAALPPEYQEAAQQHRIVPGMDKGTVFAILGAPKSKNVDLSGATPVEKWQYDLESLKTLVLTFSEGKVSKIDEL